MKIRNLLSMAVMMLLAGIAYAGLAQPAPVAVDLVNMTASGICSQQERLPVIPSLLAAEFALSRRTLRSNSASVRLVTQMVTKSPVLPKSPA